MNKVRNKRIICTNVLLQNDLVGNTSLNHTVQYDIRTVRSREKKKGKQRTCGVEVD